VTSFHQHHHLSFFLSFFSFFFSLSRTCTQSCGCVCRGESNPLLFFLSSSVWFVHNGDGIRQDFNQTRLYICV
jgi:hypothetical protein